MIGSWGSMNRAVQASGPVYGPFPNYSGPDVGGFDMGYRGSRGVATSKIAGVNAALQRTAMGRAAIGGAAESLGFYVEGMSDQPVGSFLGISETMHEMGVSTDKFKRTMGGVNKLAAQGKYGAAGRALYKQSGRAIRSIGAKGAMTFAGKTAMKSIPLISTALMAAEGYRSGGVMGALGGIGESMAWSAGLRMAGAVLGGGVLPVLAGIGAIGVGTYALGEAGRAHAKSLRETEWASGGAIDALSSVGAATNRQRSMMALNNTHLNGRMAMGNEGLLMHGDTTTGMRGF